ncbi:MAG: aldo/keto reductase [Planctomycetota bacterium]
MLTATIPRTGLATSRLGFGTASLHHLLTSGQRMRLLATAYDKGFAHFDTAPLYGEGLAERTLGLFLSNGRRNRVTVATKVGISARVLPELFPQWMYCEKAADAAVRLLGFAGQRPRRRALSLRDVEKSFTKSLRNLRTDAVDVLFVHEPAVSEIGSIAGLADWLRQQKSVGRLRYTGLAGSASECVAVVREVPDAFDILQVEDSLDGHEADVVIEAGLPLQITYGYLRLKRQHDNAAGGMTDPRQCLSGALNRNAQGVVLVSTRNISRLEEMTAMQ